MPPKTEKESLTELNEIFEESISSLETQDKALEKTHVTLQGINRCEERSNIKNTIIKLKSVITSLSVNSSDFNVVFLALQKPLNENKSDMQKLIDFLSEFKEKTNGQEYKTYFSNNNVNDIIQNAAKLYEQIKDFKEDIEDKHEELKTKQTRQNKLLSFLSSFENLLIQTIKATSKGSENVSTVRKQLIEKFKDSNKNSMDMIIKSCENKSLSKNKLESFFGKIENFNDMSKFPTDIKNCCDNITNSKRIKLGSFVSREDILEKFKNISQLAENLNQAHNNTK